MDEMAKKQKLILEEVAEKFGTTAEFVSKYISDAEEKKLLFSELNSMALEHAKLQKEFEIKSKALKMVTEKLNLAPDLQIQKQYETGIN